MTPSRRIAAASPGGTFAELPENAEIDCYSVLTARGPIGITRSHFTGFGGMSRAAKGADCKSA
ncbi:MAG: hypothetical protein KDJ63_11825, partial [Nitratireductor sp.]|nr:hypothetical protein [Nitratireductor sp.]